MKKPKKYSVLAFTRTAHEYGHFLWNKKDIMSRMPKGDGHPVLFLPGFGTGDSFMFLTRKVFAEKGYRVHRWRCGTNLGPSQKLLDNLNARFKELIEQNNGQKISIVGWSLGGIYARELARAYPEHVRGVVTLGTPFAAGQDPKAVGGLVRKVFEILNPDSPFLNDEELQEQSLIPPAVPTTSIYSKGDGVVSWKACINPDTPLSENIDVTPSHPAEKFSASHTGLIVNEAVLMIVADRLARAHGDKWVPFDVSEYPEMKGLFDENPAHNSYTPPLPKKGEPKLLFPRKPS